MPSIRTVRPFDSHGCLTSFHNALLDSVMPSVSPNAWKILCLIVRQTVGWQRGEAGLSYQVIQSGTGIKSRPTIAGALKELLAMNLIERARADEQTEMSYRLNPSAEVQWMPQKALTTPVQKMNYPQFKNQTAPSSKNELPPSSKNELHIRKETKNTWKQGETRIVDSKERGKALVRTARRDAPPQDDFSEPLPTGLDALKKQITSACGYKKIPDHRTADEITTQAIVLNSQGVTVEEIREIIDANPKKHFKTKFFAQDVIAARAADRRSESGAYVHKPQDACRAGKGCGGGGVLVVFDEKGEPRPTECECYSMR